MTTIARHLVTVTIRSRQNNYEKTLEFLIVPHISQAVPDQPINRNAMKIPPNMKLADPSFHRPGPVDMLLSSGIALSSLCVGKIDLSTRGESDLFLQKTLFGWVIGGSAPSAHLPRHGVCHVTSNTEFDLERFWSLEEATAHAHHRTADEAACENYFRETVTRNNDGRYIVALPFNGKQTQLGESRSRAIHRLSSTERRLRQDPELGRRYNAVLQEYLDLGHMTEITPIGQRYYLPHHSVIKEGTLTTKVRVVFDGSAKTSTGISLNETLRVGPTIQDDIFSLLLRFRIHRWVLTGDIEKMYRQVLVRSEDRRYQRILWRDSGGSIKTYQLNTVTFGLSAAPYLAIRCIHQLADDEGHRYPKVAEILKRDLYVDDLLTGTQTEEEAIALRDEINNLLKLGGFNLRQWASNKPELLTGLPAENINLHLQLGDSSTLKTLGVFWNSTTDDIVYTVKPTNDPARVTKRTILSETAKIFDPLGLLGPVIIRAKTMMQRLWALKLHWDEALPQEIHTEWTNFYKQLPVLNNFSIGRGVTSDNARETELHGFCDASQSAYGACIYLRSIDRVGQISINLLCAKSRVAPLKLVTIPRLELCGAQLLAILMETIKTTIPINVRNIVYWTDSTIVLHWLNTSPQRLQTFVANRVADIQSKTRPENWRHVRTHENPADLISRGQTPEEFMKPSIWQCGPSWLQEEEAAWPALNLTFPETPLEQKKNICLATTVNVNTDLLTRYSSIGKLQRVVAYCLRFKRDNRNRGRLKLAELTAAHDKIICLTQEATLKDVITTLKNGENLQRQDIRLPRLAKLSPFIDKSGMLRVGGRLQRAKIPYAQRHPIILPKSHHITRLIIEREHLQQLHAGAQATLYALRQRYWPLDGRNAVRKITRSCVKCFKQKPPPVDYVMGNLPEARVTESRPFTNVGIDYCGPFYVKEKRYRNKARIKVYVAVFVCLAVKAVHLEVVGDLTTEAFMAALDRFIARRGICSAIYSDNGTNFVGANNELQELYQLLGSEKHRDQIHQFSVNHAIRWHFIPPQSPHFGGLWEAAVKSFKHHLRRIVGEELLTYEAFNTLVIQIEAALNSRPLTALSSDANDLLVLTPGHVLIGQPLTCRPELDFRDTPTNRLSMWQHIQGLKQHFWTRWHREYISELNQRTKWTKGAHDIKEGTVVLLKEDHLPALQWAMGRVTRVHPGADGTVRAVTVKTAKGTFDRNVKKLAALPIQQEEQLDFTGDAEPHPS